jgi:hypothetical protein
MSKVRALLTARSIALYLFWLPYCSGARDPVFSATAIMVRPTCLNAKLQSTGKRTIVLKPERSVMPDFFISITSRQNFQRFGAKPYVRGILVMEQSSAAIRGSDAPAFIVEKERADG